MVQQPLRAVAARQLIRDIVENGTVDFGQHALDEMAKDNLGTIDILNILRGGVVDEAEFEHGAWRHKVRTLRIEVIVEIEDEESLFVVTAWRRT